MIGWARRIAQAASSGWEAKNVLGEEAGELLGPCGPLQKKGQDKCGRLGIPKPKEGRTLTL